MFYQCALVDFDMDVALDCLIFVYTHFAINTQIYYGILSMLRKWFFILLFLFTLAIMFPSFYISIKTGRAIK